MKSDHHLAARSKFWQTCYINFIIFLYLVTLTANGSKQISDVVLIMGYVSQTQIFLNSFSNIQDSLTDMLVGLERLALNKSVSAISLEDLI